MKFYDNLKTPIPEGLFHTVVYNFQRSSSFYVEAIFDTTTDKENVPAVVTPIVSFSSSHF